MLPRSVSPLVATPAKKLIKSASTSSIPSMTTKVIHPAPLYTNTKQTARNNFHNSSSSLKPIAPSSSSSSSRPSFKTGALLALPALILATDFNDEDKENDCVKSTLKCSTNSLSLKGSSTGILMPLEASENRLCIGVSMIPHPQKVAKGGEDAYFISDDMKAIGIADGVGGWGDIGVDPALYARMLMASGKFCADSTHPTYRDPVRIMSDAYEHSMEIQGSSTCCIVLLDGHCLRTANLGDSGFMVMRGSEIIFRTKEQQHSFNFPYQLGTGSADFPSHAVSVTVNIQPGDLVIIGTDGLWDNLYDDEIVNYALQASEPMTIAQLIARNAHEAAASKSLISPFAKAARENGYPLATGGKMDDITVVCARVVLSSDGNSISFAA